MLLLHTAERQGMQCHGRVAGQAYDACLAPRYTSVRCRTGYSGAQQRGVIHRANQCLAESSGRRPGAGLHPVPGSGADLAPRPVEPPEQHTLIASQIARAQLCVLEQCGHMSTLEQPEAVNAASVSWLAQAPEKNVTVASRN